MDKLLPALEDKQYVISVILDYSACFDALSCSILYDKLERHSIRGVSLDFINTLTATPEMLDSSVTPRGCCGASS